MPLPEAEVQIFGADPPCRIVLLGQIAVFTLGVILMTLPVSATVTVMQVPPEGKLIVGLGLPTFVPADCA